ncbi:MAG TPA: MarR family transcriptional regulator [Xanthomonadaceae bacterium]|nr:MarR family transcriptional regulator [Xanthomonadaceae bacterium]
MSTTSPCTCFRLRRAARHVSQSYDRALEPAGLSLNQYSILRRCAESVALGPLAERLGMDRSTLSRNLAPLLRAGLLDERRGEDARQRLIVLTLAGQARLAQARPLWQTAQDRLEAAYGKHATAQLHAALDALDALLVTGVAA